MEILKKIGRVVVRTAIFTYCKIVYRIKTVGKENIPADGALIFCGNHRTYLDPPVIIVTAGRHMRFMAKEELRKNPFLAFLGVIFEGIYVKRDAKDISAMKEAIKTLKSGGCIGLFPEGTRNGLEKNDGKLKNGAAYLALKTGAKIVPIGIQGEAKPFHRTTIVYGEPLDFSTKYNISEDKEAADKATDELKEKIIMLTKKEV
ncbi:MAG: 1-acyl-sn-glycerol-3-phosphate acyltransferase [Clostridia bacterium]|nr:1-acyl-sn-glycerol-3-phosphate acyltransferase [Clostridia bacterium]